MIALPRIQRETNNPIPFVLETGRSLQWSGELKRPGPRVVRLRLPFDVDGVPQRRTLDLSDPPPLPLYFEQLIVYPSSSGTPERLVSGSGGGSTEGWSFDDDARWLRLDDVHRARPNTMRLRLFDVPAPLAGLQAEMVVSHPPYHAENFVPMAWAGWILLILAIGLFLRSWWHPRLPVSVSPLERDSEFA